ncbi:GNAT family N-acetyltransferase [bacterium]|nr:GNAT family N-acetyltransferase [bacterium]
MIPLPQPTLQTARLVLRAPVLTDAVTMNDAIRASFAELKPWMPWCQQVPAVEETRQNIENLLASEDPKKEIRFLAFEIVAGRFVACIGLHPQNLSIPSFEIGYWIDSRWSGRGYMTEAVRAVTDYAVNSLGARRVQIRAALSNARSWKIPERLGYTREAVLHNSEIEPDGRLDDTVVYAIWR